MTKTRIFAPNAFGALECGGLTPLFRLGKTASHSNSYGCTKKIHRLQGLPERKELLAQDFRHGRRSPRHGGASCHFRSRAREHAGVARADKIDAQGRTRLKEVNADRDPLFPIRARCFSASTSSSASNWRAMSESFPDHATPTTTGGKSDNGSARNCDGGLNPGTATVKPMP